MQLFSTLWNKNRTFYVQIKQMYRFLYRLILFCIIDFMCDYLYIFIYVNKNFIKISKDT